MSNNETGKIPHQAVLTVRGVVNRQMPDGLWHPTATFNKGFTITFDGMTEQEVVDKLKDHLEKMRESCQIEQE